MKSISSRFTLVSVIVSVLTLLSIISINYLYVKNELLKSANDKARLEVYKAQNKINKMLFKATKSSNSAKNQLQREGLKQSSITHTLTNTLEKNENIYGMTVAMEPGVVYKKLFSPYFYKKKGHIVYTNLATKEYDYLSKPWYSDVKISKKPKWSKPYFDRGGGNALMVTYSNPIFQGGKFAGIVTIDLSLEKLKKIINSIRILKSGYAFLLSKNSVVLVSPKGKMIMKRYNQNIKYNQIIKYKSRWVYYSKVNSTGWILGVVIPKKELFHSLYQMTWVLLLLAFLGVFILIVFIYILSKKITKPLKTIIEITNEISNGNFDKKMIKPKTKDEVYQLFKAVEKMQKEIKTYISNLKIATKKEQKIKSELDIANKIQMNMLPSAQVCREDDIINLYAFLKPAKAVGGDFYDFFRLDDDKLCFVIADVSGKGMPAALFMAVSISYIRAFAQQEAKPSQIIKKVNKALCQNNKANMFVTMILSIVDLKTGKMTYVNAGHTKPYILSCKNQTLKLGHNNDPIVGFMPDLEFCDHSLHLKRGEKLFLYTDGVNEAFSKDGKQFGDKNLAKILDQNRSSNSQIILSSMKNAISDFTKDEEQSDDITILIVECSNKKEKQC